MARVRLPSESSQSRRGAGLSQGWRGGWRVWRWEGGRLKEGVESGL